MKCFYLNIFSVSLFRGPTGFFHILTDSANKLLNAVNNLLLFTFKTTFIKKGIELLVPLYGLYCDSLVLWLWSRILNISTNITYRNMGWLNVDVKVLPVYCSWLHCRVEAFGALTIVSQPYTRILVLLSSGCSNSNHAAINVSYCIYQHHLLLNWFLINLNTLLLHDLPN